MTRLLEVIKEKLEKPTRRVEVFEARNRIQYVNQNIMSVVRFSSWPVKFSIQWLDKLDIVIGQHLTRQGMLLKRGMATSRLYMSHDDMGFGLNNSVAVDLLELVGLLQNKWETIFWQELFWRMEELTK